MNQEANHELSRMTLNLATGAGKTTVMAMLIARQTINAVRHPSSKFTRGFLIVALGLTIKVRSVCFCRMTRRARRQLRDVYEPSALTGRILPRFPLAELVRSKEVFLERGASGIPPEQQVIRSKKIQTGINSP